MDINGDTEWSLTCEFSVEPPGIEPVGLVFEPNRH
jgi:hypothetical protein